MTRRPVTLDPLCVDVFENDAGQVDGQFDWNSLWMDEAFFVAIIKANQGTQCAPQPWFTKNWQAIRESAIAQGRYGRTALRGCYSYLEVDQDWKAQAEVFLKMVELAGGWDIGDLWPMLDVESAANPANPGSAKLMDAMETWAQVVGGALGRQCLLYGNIYLAESGVTSPPAGFGCLTVARYTGDLPPVTYERIGWSITEPPVMPTVWGWQYAGTEDPNLLKGYPGTAPIGPSGSQIKSDITAVIAAGGGQAAVDFTLLNLHAP